MVDINKLKNDQYQLYDYLNRNHYSYSYCQKFKSVISSVIDLSNASDLQSQDYLELFKNHYKNKWKPKTARFMLGIFKSINRYEVDGILPNGKKNTSISDRQSFQSLSSSYQNLLIDFRKYSLKLRSPHSVNSDVSAALTFFTSLQKNGITQVSKITQSEVLAILSNPDYPQHNSTSRNAIKRVLAFGAEAGYKGCDQAVAFLPKQKVKQRIFQGLTKEEIDKIDKGLEDGILSKRDTAILTTLRFTGLRASDVASLKISDIDWKKDIITKTQVKTNETVTLPLITPVGNAIFDYLMEERPNSCCPYIFLSERAPYGPINGGTISRISIRSLPKLMVRNSRDNLTCKGAHLFRHFVATSLMENGESQPVISSTLGQTSPHSLTPYLTADDIHLRACSRDIRNFPVSKEVFNFGKEDC